MANVHQQGALDSIAKLRETQKNSDLLIECEGRQWNVHKAIVCSASDLIAAECDSQMLEGRSGVIKHEEYDADTVERMISYIYKQTYGVEDENQLFLPAKPQTDDSQNGDAQPLVININNILVAHINCYGVGDYYDITNLKLLAVDRFAAVADHGWQADGFIDVIKAVYKRTSASDRAMRDALLHYAMQHCVELTKDESLMSELGELEEAQEFAASMFQHVVRQQILDKGSYEQQLGTKDRQITEKDRKIEELEADNVDSRNEAARREQQLRDVCDHTEAVMEGLVTAIDELPDTCRNARCDCEFGGLRLERKGHPGYGAGSGDFVVRCGRCRCKLS